MDINKILFEQLNNKEIQNIFNVEDVNTADAVQKESVGENSELKKEISSALNIEDETSSLQIGNKKSSEKLNSAVLNTQNLMNMLSSETQRYNKEEKKIEKEIQSKSEEYQKLAEEIQAKQEEYEKLISEAESSNDESVISNANSLGEEINSMVSDLESIKTNIQNLETSLASKQSISNMFNSQLNSLSKVQSTLNKEAVKESVALNSVSAADAVQEVNGVNQVEESAQTQETTPVRQHVEIKSMEEYKEILDGKFNELWNKFGDADSVVQYVKNNLGTYMDITGDGRVDKIDLQIFDNYLKTLPAASTSDPVEQEKGRAYVLGIKKFASEVRKQTYILNINDNNLYDLNDLENYSKLGGSVNVLVTKNLDKVNISKEENWESKLASLGIKRKETIQDIKNVAEYIKNNPEKAKYAGLMVAYENHVNNSKRKSEETFLLPNIDLCDFNGNGCIDVEDYANLRLDIDLDGDGKISLSEQSFLKKVKENLQKTVYNDMVRKSTLNTASIDDVLSYYENFDENSYINSQSKQLSEWATGYMSSVKEEMEEYKAKGLGYGTLDSNGHLGMGDRRMWSAINGYAGNSVMMTSVNGLLDGTGSGLVKHGMNPDAKEIVDLFHQCTEQGSPKNTYLHYINSADLSKEKLQEILNKINSSSANAKLQLADVKALVEQKLAAMS